MRSIFSKHRWEGNSQALSALAWRRFKRNRLTVMGMLIIATLTLIAYLGANIRPDNTPNANEQILAINTQPPGFSVQVLKVRKNQEVPALSWFDLAGFGGQPNAYQLIPITSYRFEDDFIYVEKFLGASNKKLKETAFHLADVVYPLNVEQPAPKLNDQGAIQFQVLGAGGQMQYIKELQETIVSQNISIKTYRLGTDPQGRDFLSRIMAGTIISLSVGFISVLIALLVGVFLGALAGYYRGWVDSVIMWLINVVWSIPTVLMVIAITLALGKGYWQVFIAVGLTMWVEVARVVRGQVLSIREKEFVAAGRALGFSAPRIIIRHILPNIMGPVIVISAANFAAAILIEAGLSFLGIGAQPPESSWGSIIAANRVYLTTEYAYLAIIPGTCIMVLVLAFMLIGNGMRDALDVKTGGGTNLT